MEAGSILQGDTLEAVNRLTRLGALANNTTARTIVPINVHQTLNALIRPIATVPAQLISPDSTLTPQATAAISTRDSVLPDPTSASEAMYKAVLGIAY